MKLTRHWKNRIPNGLAILAGAVLLIGSLTLGNQTASDTRTAAACDSINCTGQVQEVAQEQSTPSQANEQRESDIIPSQNALHAAAQSAAENSTQALHMALLLLIPGH